MAKVEKKPDNDCRCCKKCGSPWHLTEDCGEKPNRCKTCGNPHHKEQAHWPEDNNFLTDEGYEKIGV